MTLFTTQPSGKVLRSIRRCLMRGK